MTTAQAKRLAKEFDRRRRDHRRVGRDEIGGDPRVAGFEYGMARAYEIAAAEIRTAAGIKNTR